MYRILAAQGEVTERRRQASPSRLIRNHRSLLAEAPNQVWSLDITKLMGPGEVVLLLSLVILDKSLAAVLLLGRHYGSTSKAPASFKEFNLSMLMEKQCCATRDQLTHLQC